jgi:HSP20 family protein
MAEQGSRVPTRSTAGSGEVSRGGLFSLHREIDRLFDDFSRRFSMSPFGRRADWEPLAGLGSDQADLVPRVDVMETDDAVQITAELPGMSENDIDISLSDGVLTLKGEKKEEKEVEDKGYYLSERRFGFFQRSFRLPEGIDEDRIEASFDKGVLKITLPKTQEATNQAKKISVKSA